jgi:UDP-glucose 4-epimerase
MALAASAARRGLQVNAVARRWPPALAQSLGHPVALLEADAADALRLYEHMQGCAVVYFLAYDGVPLSDEADFLSEYRSNILLLTSTMLAAERADVARLVLASSGGTVYGNVARQPIDESETLTPISHYGNIKQLSENLVRSYCRIARSFDFVIARLSNPFGPQQVSSNRTGLVVTALKAASSGSPMTVLGGGAQIRDYLYIDDAVEALQLLGTERDAAGEVFNVGSGIGHSVLEVLAMVEKVTGRSLEMVHRPARTKDVDINILSVEKIMRMTSWKPRHSCEQGVALTWDALVKLGLAYGAA